MEHVANLFSLEVGLIAILNHADNSFSSFCHDQTNGVCYQVSQLLLFKTLLPAHMAYRVGIFRAQ